jgi:hypothetical protein
MGAPPGAAPNVGDAVRLHLDRRGTGQPTLGQRRTKAAGGEPRLNDGGDPQHAADYGSDVDRPPPISRNALFQADSAFKIAEDLVDLGLFRPGP